MRNLVKNILLEKLTLLFPRANTVITPWVSISFNIQLHSDNNCIGLK